LRDLIIESDANGLLLLLFHDEGSVGT
jgi:hypothetical protein